jgi:hypothetical protein
MNYGVTDVSLDQMEIELLKHAEFLSQIRVGQHFDFPGCDEPDVEAIQR